MIITTTILHIPILHSCMAQYRESSGELFELITGYHGYSCYY